MLSSTGWASPRSSEDVTALSGTSRTVISSWSALCCDSRAAPVPKAASAPMPTAPAMRWRRVRANPPLAPPEPPEPPAPTLPPRPAAAPMPPSGAAAPCALRRACAAAARWRRRPDGALPMPATLPICPPAPSERPARPARCEARCMLRRVADEARCECRADVGLRVAMVLIVSFHLRAAARLGPIATINPKTRAEARSACARRGKAPQDMPNAEVIDDFSR